MKENKNNRRRGDELLESLFETTFKLMNNVRLTNLTFAQVADAANTSRTVLYRRWSTMFDLLQDIYAYKAKKLFEGSFLDQMKDNGSLRADLVQLLTIYQNIYNEIGADVLNNYYYIRSQDKTQQKKPSFHASALDKHLHTVNDILARANQRGQQTKTVAKITLMLPYDLVRIENLIRPECLNAERILTLVDEVLIPVFGE
jgi:AcrR family transcriptional regulator